MTYNPGEQEQAAVFASDLRDVAPLRLIEPLARTLGAFEGISSAIEYSYVDVVKMAGHACPTTAAAYECCRAALSRLYPDETPVRGQIEVTVYGEPDDGTYGVIGQVFGLITGAATETGFKGLATFFRRQNLLKYESAGADATGMLFRFKRMDNGKVVQCRLIPDRMPPPAPEDAKRLSELMRKVLWEAAKTDEIAEFHKLWRRHVTAVFESAKRDHPWLSIQEEK